jgi:hypothetical protein
MLTKYICISFQIKFAAVAHPVAGQFLHATDDDDDTDRKDLAEQTAMQQKSRLTSAAWNLLLSYG